MASIVAAVAISERAKVNSFSGVSRPLLRWMAYTSALGRGPSVAARAGSYSRTFSTNFAQVPGSVRLSIATMPCAMR